MARLRPTNLKCVSAVIRYKIVVNIFHYSAARVGGRSREPSPRAWNTSAWEEEGGGGSRTDRIGGGEEGVLRKEERERDCDTRRASRASTGSLSSEEETRPPGRGLKRHRGRRVVVAASTSRTKDDILLPPFDPPSWTILRFSNTFSIEIVKRLLSNNSMRGAKIVVTFSSILGQFVRTAWNFNRVRVLKRDIETR